MVTELNPVISMFITMGVWGVLLFLLLKLVMYINSKLGETKLRRKLAAAKMAAEKEKQAKNNQ